MLSIAEIILSRNIYICIASKSTVIDSLVLSQTTGVLKELQVPIYEIDDKSPRVGSGTWVAPSAEIIGDVEIGDNCYIGFGAIIRGDFANILFGE